MKRTYFYLLIGTAILTNACSHIKGFEKILIKPKQDKLEVKQKITKQKRVAISCNRERIQDYIDKGWAVISSEEKDVPCTWKVKRARRGCNLEKDKGCRLTVPDQMGKQVIYLIEGEFEVNAENSN
tara:strand:+ start:1168 stop:1545 length:378 start_codon:yes stop_codon:yes gene_type:complete